MLIIVDKRIPFPARERLSEYGNIVEFQTNNIVYEAISGHPDIFFTLIDDQLIIAPNLPKTYFQILNDHKIFYNVGEENVGKKYPGSSKYNIVADDSFIIHNFRNTDSAILRIGEDMDLIQVDQGYTRCNLIPLGNKHYVTSDKGIARTLKRFELNVLYVDPEGIQLPGYKNGFIGGCAGIYDKKIFFIGRLNYLKQANELRSFLISQDFEIIELYEGPLIDGGSLIFI